MRLQDARQGLGNPGCVVIELETGRAGNSISICLESVEPTDQSICISEAKKSSAVRKLDRPWKNILIWDAWDGSYRPQDPRYPPG